MSRVRVENSHPAMLKGAVRAAVRHCVGEYGVSEKSVHRALERKYAEELSRELTEARKEIALLNMQLEDLRDTARVGYEPPQNGELEELREQLAVATIALSLHNEPLYAVQTVQTVEQAANAVADGMQLGSLALQLVLVRPVHVYDGKGAVLHHAEAQHGGAAICTAAGLEQACLPVPKARA